MVKEGQTFLRRGSPLGGGGNKTIRITEVDRRADETRIELDQSVSTLGTQTTVDDLRSKIDPREVHRNRSEEARTADRAKDAPLTTDPLEWASDPGGKDFPGVDTGPVFREQESDNFEVDAFAEDTVGVSDVDDVLGF